MKIKKSLLIFFFVFLFSVSFFYAKGAVLENIRYFTYKDYTRVVLDLSSPVTYTSKELKEKNRVRFFFDLKNTVLSEKLKKENRIEFKGSYIREIRVGQFRKDIARVVLEFKEAKDKRYFTLLHPFRIVIDIYGKNAKVSVVKTNKKLKNDKKETQFKTGTPEISGEKKYSMARQLGLTVKRIVIDPGHGGKDPGTIGRYYKTKEKVVVLDIAKRLKYYLKRYTKLEVYMTRDKDIFIPLEQRTAYANSKRADLFISIHANSAANRRAYGLSTFWLNFTTDPHSIRIAASENASSQRSIWELKSLLKKITLTSKLIESKIFATKVQYSTLYYIRKYYRYPDYRVRKAPFYVLIGASMPAILVETGFLSNKTNELLLRSSRFRNRLAFGLYKGIISYINSLR